jgi:hypothetical protein
MFHCTRPKHFFQAKKRYIALLLVISFTFLVYLKTLAPTYTWQHWGSDAGDLIACIYNLGVPHPPGTPLYILITQPFRLFPLGDPAYKINLASAIFSVTTVMVLLLIVYELTQSLLASALAGFFLAFSRVFWSQSIITEVYTLNSFLMALVIYFMLRWQQKVLSGDRLTDRHLFIALFTFGLALCNHTSSFMLFPAILYLTLSTKGKKIFHPRYFLLFTFYFLLGLLPYLYLPLRALMHPPLNWGNPSTLGQLIDHITGKEYSKMLFYKNQSLVLDNVVSFLILLFENFNLLGISLAAVGFVFGFINRKRILNFLIFVFLFQALFNINYKIPNIETFYLPSFFVMACWIGLGTDIILGFLDKFHQFLLRTWPIVLVSLEFPQMLDGKIWELSLASAIYGLLTLALFFGPAFNLKTFYSQVDLSDDLEASAYGEGVFSVLEPNAVVLTEGDKFTLVLDYFRWVVYKERHDVAVFPNGIYLQDWRIENSKRLYPWLIFPDLPVAKDPKEALEAMLAFIDENYLRHPIYLTLDYPPPREDLSTRTSVENWIIESIGPIYKVVGKLEKLEANE